MSKKTVYFICHDEIETDPLKNPVDTARIFTRNRHPPPHDSGLGE